MSRVQKIKFQWYFDFSTSAQSMQIITVQAGGQNVVDRLKPFFAAYKRYKLGSVKCTFVPASTLPVDPTGLSYEGGETTVDPRDQLNMGLTRITNGEDFIDDITGLGEGDQQKLYDAMLMDPRWYKWSLQSGLKRSAYPKFWQIGQLHQDYFPGAIINVPLRDNRVADIPLGTAIEARHRTFTGAGGEIINAQIGTDPRGFFQTGHKGRLSWMPTDALMHTYNAQGNIVDDPNVAAIPCIDLFKIITPKAHKTRYYYRCYVTETVYFAQPITSISIMPGSGSNQTGMLDRFLYGELKAAKPGYSGTLYDLINHPPNDGSGTKEI